MQTKIFIGYLLDYALKEALQGKEHTLTTTLKEGKEYIGLHLSEKTPSLTILHHLREKITHQLDSLHVPYLLDQEEMVLFPELLIG